MTLPLYILAIITYWRNATGLIMYPAHSYVPLMGLFLCIFSGWVPHTGQKRRHLGIRSRSETRSLGLPHLILTIRWLPGRELFSQKQNNIIIDYVLQCHAYVHGAMRSQVVLKMSTITRDLPKTCYLLLRDGSYFAGECNLFVLVLFLCNSTLLS